MLNSSSNIFSTEIYKIASEEVEKKHLMEINEIKNEWQSLRKDAKEKLKKISPLQEKIDIVITTKSTQKDIVQKAVTLEKLLVQEIIDRLSEELIGEELENGIETLQKYIDAVTIPEWLQEGADK